MNTENKDSPIALVKRKPPLNSCAEEHISIKARRCAVIIPIEPPLGSTFQNDENDEGAQVESKSKYTK